MEGGVDDGCEEILVGDIYLINILVDTSPVFDLQFDLLAGSQGMFDDDNLAIPVKGKVLPVGFNLVDLESRV